LELDRAELSMQRRIADRIAWIDEELAASGEHPKERIWAVTRERLGSELPTTWAIDGGPTAALAIHPILRAAAREPDIEGRKSGRIVNPLPRKPTK
jgi:hypothetical protein